GHEADVVGLRLRAQTKIRLEYNLVAPAEVLKIDGGHSAVGDSEQSAFFGTNAGGAQADVLDDSGTIAEFTDVADAEDLVGEDRNTAEKICDGLLRAETNRQASDAEAGEGGA